MMRWIETDKGDPAGRALADRHTDPALQDDLAKMAADAVKNLELPL